MYQVKEKYRGQFLPEPTQEKMEFIQKNCIELFNDYFEEV